MSNGHIEWICSVCGYVHNGNEPPSQCMVCGAPSDKFDSRAGESKPSSPDIDGFKCLICNYLHHGDGPPDTCPVCGAGKKKFEAVAKKTDMGLSTETKRHIVIVGAGIAGVSAAESIRAESSSAEITLISKEDPLPYFRLNLTRLLAGEVDNLSLPIHSENWYAENRINLIRNAEVTECLPDVKSIILRDGQRILYDRLILAAGAHPFIPPVPGAQKSGVTSLRTLDQVNNIMESASVSKSAVIVGGGILGLEAAAALAASYASLTVTVIEGFDYLMPRQLNRKASHRLMDHVKSLGISLETGTSVKEIEGDERVSRILLADGKSLPADLVIFAAGVRPNSYLARISGLNVNQGVIVNDSLESSVDGIYAAGDIAEHRGVLYGLWNAAMYQGTIAGLNAVGRKSEFGGIPRSNTIKVLGVDLFSIGVIEPCDGSCTVFEKDETDVYIHLVFRDNHLEGAILYGDTTQSGPIKKAIEQKMDFLHILRSGLSVDDLLDSM